MQPADLRGRHDATIGRHGDGSSVGGQTVTFPRAQLNQMFGSTLPVDGRTFTFQPSFGCGRTKPRSIAADIVIVDTAGNARTLTVGAVFQ